MLTPFVLLFLGLFFVLLEFYMPGAVMAVIGIILLLAGIVTFADQSQSIALTFLFMIGEAVLLYALIKITLKRIPKATPSFSIYLHKDQEGYQASHFDKAAIGKHGIVVSDLKPGGYIIVDGKKQQAISQSGYIVEGREVKVIGGEGESLIVREIKSTERSTS